MQVYYMAILICLCLSLLLLSHDNLNIVAASVHFFV